MEEIILAKIGETILKGLNRKNFENILVKNIKTSIKKLGEFNVYIAQSTIYIEPLNENIDLFEVEDKISKVFGIASYSRACAADKNMESIKESARSYLYDELMGVNTFKIESKRADKKFPLKSPEISREVGGYLYESFDHLDVDVHNPDITITIEIREKKAYIRGNAKQGAGGLPVGTGGNACVLISGGIDSPVASYMMAKRGMKLTAVHFASPPYTSERALQKVKDLLKKVSLYSGRIKMITVPFTEIQESIKGNCEEDLFTIIMRRLMMKISEKIALQEDALALITGESLGQVASQTVKAIYCTNEATSLPVFRPLIGMDKDEIVKIARKIDTFDISIQPFEDCCTVFTPKHPKTRPNLEYVKKEENRVDFDTLIDKAIENIEVTII